MRHTPGPWVVYDDWYIKSADKEINKAQAGKVQGLQPYYYARAYRISYSQVAADEADTNAK